MESRPEVMLWADSISTSVSIIQLATADHDSIMFFLEACQARSLGPVYDADGIATVSTSLPNV